MSNSREVSTIDARSLQANCAGLADQKARQSAKIRELGQALIADGYYALDEQAEALGLTRSTTWTILRANHKGSGLSAAIINRMLAAPQLPPRVRLKILEYINEKRAGHFGDSKLQLRRFVARLSATSVKGGRYWQRQRPPSVFQEERRRFLRLPDRAKAPRL